MNKVWMLAGLMMVSAVGAWGADRDEMMDDMDIISLRSDSAVERRTFHYPGLGAPRMKNPDCLVLVTEKNVLLTTEQKALKELALELEVRDGIMFDEEGVARITPLPVTTVGGRLISGKLVFMLKHLGLFMTYIDVRAKDGRTLQEVVSDTLGDKGGSIVGLQMVRGCRIR